MSSGTATGTTAEKAGNPLRNVLSSRDFRLLLGGSTVSFLGDQFTLVALPWLVLAVTHDAAALGAVLALQGLPRAALMLFGGAVSDRLSPSQVMLAANAARTVFRATPIRRAISLIGNCSARCSRRISAQSSIVITPPHREGSRFTRRPGVTFQAALTTCRQPCPARAATPTCGTT